MLSAPLTDVAAMLRLHPATVLRTITGNPAASWSNPLVQFSDVTRTYGIPGRKIRQCLSGDDSLITAQEAAAILGVTVAVVRNRMDRGEIVPAIKLCRQGSTLRFSRRHIEALAREKGVAA